MHIEKVMHKHEIEIVSNFPRHQTTLQPAKLHERYDH